MSDKRNWKKLVVSVAIALGAGWISTLLAPGIPEIYATLYKPPLAPQGWLFPLVWTVLYVLMGVAAGRIWQGPAGVERSSALLYYGIQLAVNILWPVLFFRFETYVTAFFWLALLWYLVFITFRKFTRLDQTAGNLLIPYLVWLVFAGYLNLAIAIAEH
ncbi:MAG: tryptophan-rich sensory protein [Clostridium sp.]|nr:tryptophan-rich sensory protein [Acetatifactor muris]MCM1526425.1 tryptophan-rich sensory protein [Bacteroides sp.]MCM1563212.1 tryptophan-rich sensory protein [Clostridium sp.]